MNLQMKAATDFLSLVTQDSSNNPPEKSKSIFTPPGLYMFNSLLGSTLNALLTATLVQGTKDRGLI